MAPMTEREQTAAALVRSINAMSGAWVVSTPQADKIRFQVLDGDKNRVLQQLKDWNWEPAFVSILPRVTFNGMAAASVYEIVLPKERQEIPDARIAVPRDEVATPKKSDVEMEGMRKYLGLK